MGRTARAFAILLVVLAAYGCEGDSSSSSTSSTGATTITGREHLAWDQQAASLETVNSYTFTVVVDGAAAGTLSASCTATPDPVLYTCAAPLPPLSDGAHVLAVRTTDTNGASSATSSGVSITVQSASTSRTAAWVIAMQERALLSMARVCMGQDSGRQCYELRRIGTDLAFPEHPTELPDGDIVVVDQGRLLMLRDGVARPMSVGTQSGDRLTDVALAPDSAKTREVYALEVMQTARGRAADVVRFKAVGGVLGERAVIVPGIALPAEGDPSLLVQQDIVVAVPRDTAQPGVGAGTVLRYDRRGASAGRTLGNPAIAWGPARPTAMLSAGDAIVTAGAVPGPLVLGVLTPDATTPVTTRVTESFVASGGVRALARVGQLMLFAAVDGGAYLSVQDANGEPITLQRLDTKGAAITGVATTKAGGIVATAMLPVSGGAPGGRVYELIPDPVPR